MMGEGGDRAGLGKAVEHPGALAEALDQAGVGQELEVARDARLALSQNLSELAHRPLAMRTDREQPEPAGLGRGTQAVQQVVDGNLRGHRASKAVLTDMYKSLYAHVNAQGARPWHDHGSESLTIRLRLRGGRGR